MQRYKSVRYRPLVHYRTRVSPYASGSGRSSPRSYNRRQRYYFRPYHSAPFPRNWPPTASPQEEIKEAIGAVNGSGWKK